MRKQYILEFDGRFNHIHMVVASTEDAIPIIRRLNREAYGTNKQYSMVCGIKGIKNLINN